MKKKIILFYNNPEWNKETFQELQEAPTNYMITCDRTLFGKAHVVIFHLFDLYQYMKDDIEKTDSQLWVAWNMECEEHFSWMKDKEIRELFDIRMDYFRDADIVCPYYRNIKENNMPKVTGIEIREDKACMMISSPFNQSRRKEYIEKLMKYTIIDSYGRLYNNKFLANDRGRESKMELYAKYKFVIAFENAIGKDYVTEKFYDPLLAGSVPVYLGAPNIEEFAPRNECFIDVRNYKSPEELAKYLNLCMTNDKEYMKYHKWRELPFRKSFTDMVKEQDTNPFIRLCELLDKKYFGNSSY